jgi:magnesium transporter
VLICEAASGIRDAAMLGTLLGPEIQDMIQRRDFAGLRKVLAEFPLADAAEVINELPEEQRAVVFRILPTALAADVFEYLDSDAQQVLLRSLSSETAAQILNEMSPDDRTALLEELPGNAVAQLLALLTPAERKVAQQLLNYPEGTVGRLMTPDFISVRDDWTIERVLAHIRQHGRDSETINVIYVTDERGKLIDDVRIREFLLRPTDTVVRAIHDASFISLMPTDPAEKALELFKKYDRATLPVTDAEGRLLGIVTVDDMLDVQEQETTEDIQKLGGTEALDEPYMEAPIWELVRKRAVWLVVLFLGELLTASVMVQFEDELKRAVVLTFFLPLIMSSGGNSGSQASTLIIRALSLGEVRLGDWWRVMRKEILSGLVLGGTLAVVGFVRIAGWAAYAARSGHYPYSEYYVSVALAAALAIMGVVLWGTVSGSMLPFILKRFGLDPAVSSAPFVATLVDVTGLIIYFYAAAVILRGKIL